MNNMINIDDIIEENKHLKAKNSELEEKLKNIQIVFNSYMLTGERPENYRREYKIQ